MTFITFEPNQPQSFIFSSEGPYTLPNGAGCLYPLPDGAWLHLTASLADSLALLKLSPGEEFAICLYNTGNIPEWQVWLTPQTEKARAAKEVAQLDLEAQFGASLKLVQGRKERSSGEAVPNFLAPTGTEGATASPLPIPERKIPALAVASSGGRRKSAGAIPLNVAFREIVRFVVAELKDSGEQWSDQCRQDLVSTVMIAAQKTGLLCVWEREDAA